MSLTGKLFPHKGSQAVRLLGAFQFEGTDVAIRKEGDAVILEPVTVKVKESWSDFWAHMDAIRGDHYIEYSPRIEVIWPRPAEIDE